MCTLFYVFRHVTVIPTQHKKAATKPIIKMETLTHMSEHMYSHSSHSIVLHFGIFGTTRSGTSKN